MSDAPDPTTNVHSSQRRLYRISEAFGRGFGVEALFTAHPEDVEALHGREVYYGEISGKHSEIILQASADTIVEVSADPAGIAFCEEHIGTGIRSEWTPFDSWSISGHNPLEIEMDDDEGGGS